MSKKAMVVLMFLTLGFTAARQTWAAPALSAPELLSAGRADDAISLLKARTSANSSDDDAYHLLTRAYFYMERWDEALDAAERAVELQPDNSNYHLWLARSYGEKAEHSSWYVAIRMVKKIRNEFETAVQLNPSNAAARTDLAEFYMEAPSHLGGSKENARAEAAALANQDPAASHWVKARLAEKAKKYGDAETEYIAAIHSSRNPASRWLDLGAFYRNIGRPEMMKNAINRAIAADIGKSSVLFEAANMLFQTGQNFSLAIELVERYLEPNRQVEEAPLYRAHYLLGLIHEKQGNAAAAANEYRAALSLAKNFQQAQEGLRRIEQQVSRR